MPDNILVILGIAVITAAATFLASHYISRLKSKAAALEEKITGLQKDLQREQNNLANAAETKDKVQITLDETARSLAVATEREASLNRTISERDEQLKGLQTRLKSEFENIATKILKTATNQLSEKSQESLSTILNPLKLQITEFKQKIESAHIEDTRQRSVLGEQIRQISLTNQNVGMQAEALTKALTGDSQLRGRWGEVRLERLLELSGLQRGREFVVQGGDFNIKSEEGRNQRPDIIIMLPENRHFVIDSKISLIDYLEYERAETEDTREAALKKLLASFRAHIDNLAQKNYQHAGEINSHVLVFMYMSIEGVAALVLKNDEHIAEHAWKKNILLVSPSSLFSAMKTVHSIWRYERQSQNAQIIAHKAGLLYDKLCGFVGDLNEVSRKMHAAATAHNEAMKKLSSGKGNVLSRAQKLKSLGVASRKNMPLVIIDGEGQQIEDDDEESELESIETTQLPPPENRDR